MNKTKETIREFIGKAGHHDTTVHESVEPAIKHETVKPTEHEDINTAVNKEIHQDHYHRTVQPVHAKEILPEQHQHRVSDVQHRDYDHRDHENTKKVLAAENEKYKDQHVVQETTRTQSHAPTVEGEHIHHHVHETVQPVLHKETIQPHVVHTTVPIHETHHAPAQHHSTSSLPPISIDEYKQQGGSLNGRQERFDAFDGEPKTIRGTVASMHEKKDAGLKNAPDGAFHGDFDPLDGGKHHSANRIQNGNSAANGVSQGVSAHSSAQKEYRTSTGAVGNTPVGRTTTATGATKKNHPSLLDKLNPMTDSNGDGKAGFMK
ncbi:hypothetical protein F5Y04DRAFT_290156 [Hypomontagnella monticulosa]|nr:hypothetical protein F5Y04DRAFT_290156 [Hypomontagnella monticulosa]